jgi:hypothetical protein
MSSRFDPGRGYRWNQLGFLSLPFRQVRRPLPFPVPFPRRRAPGSPPPWIGATRDPALRRASRRGDIAGPWCCSGGLSDPSRKPRSARSPATRSRTSRGGGAPRSGAARASFRKAEGDRPRRAGGARGADRQGARRSGGRPRQRAPGHRRLGHRGARARRGGSVGRLGADVLGDGASGRSAGYLDQSTARSSSIASKGGIRTRARSR